MTTTAVDASVWSAKSRLLSETLTASRAAHLDGHGIRLPSRARTESGGRDRRMHEPAQSPYRFARNAFATFSAGRSESAFAVCATCRV
jgi:hypothetical protein